MIIFQKSAQPLAFAKMIIFSALLRIEFSGNFSVFKLRRDSHSVTPTTMAPKVKKSTASEAEPTSRPALPKRVRKLTLKVAESAPTDTTDEEDTAIQRTKIRRTSWTPARTERLLDWLEENPADRQKLFSDSSKDAKDEGRRKRVAKGTKSEFHKLIATYVFSVDANKDVRADFVVNVGNYTKSVDNYLGQ